MSFIVPKEESTRRLAICNKCDKKLPIGVCRECGCVIMFKTKAGFTDCPLGKWSNINPNKYDI